MNATFEVEWPDDLGPHWLNADNLLLTLVMYRPNVRFSVYEGGRVVTNHPELVAAMNADKEKDDVRKQS